MTKEDAAAWDDLRCLGLACEEAQNRLVLLNKQRSDLDFEIYQVEQEVRTLHERRRAYRKGHGVR